MEEEEETGGGERVREGRWRIKEEETDGGEGNRET